MAEQDQAAQPGPAGQVPGGLVTEQDVYLFAEGTHRRLWEKLGAHPTPLGTHFAVWAPNAAELSVVGDFNGWDRKANPLRKLPSGGIWQGFVPGVKAGARYKFHLLSEYGGYRVDKADPFGFLHEEPPRTASVVTESGYRFVDQAWMAGRAKAQAIGAPISIYECHLGSFARAPGGGFLTYRELAPKLAAHVKRLGFTHVELLPVMEHPFFGSWGYQVTGFFAPSARFGGPDDLRALIDQLHQAGIGVILDWVPAHFPSDEHALGYFDGTHLYEHADPRLGFHPDWKSLIFNYGRKEVEAFLISSACFWLDSFHADGLRVDGVASMLYLDYSRKQGEWIPNRHGGRENLEAIEFLRHLNQAIYADYPGVQTIAEESTSWPMVSRPTYVGGLGFGFKWDMGWMHDTLEYMRQDPVYRRFHHQKLTFRGLYAFAENFVLPLSHDEVVHGKGSLYGKMPGDRWQKLANLRLLFGQQWAQPGKKLLFMGSELGATAEWDHDGELPWGLLDDPGHAGVMAFVADLNRLYREEPALHLLDADPAGFEWIDCSDADQGVVSLLRKGEEPGSLILAAFNYTPVPRLGYRIGVPAGGRWTERLNSDAKEYGGSGLGNYGSVEAEAVPQHGRPFSLRLTLPPLGLVFLSPPPLPALEPIAVAVAPAAGLPALEPRVAETAPGAPFLAPR